MCNVVPNYLCSLLVPSSDNRYFRVRASSFRLCLVGSVGRPCAFDDGDAIVCFACSIILPRGIILVIAISILIEVCELCRIKFSKK